MVLEALDDCGAELLDHNVEEGDGREEELLIHQPAARQAGRHRQYISRQPRGSNSTTAWTKMKHGQRSLARSLARSPEGFAEPRAAFPERAGIVAAGHEQLVDARHNGDKVHNHPSLGVVHRDLLLRPDHIACDRILVGGPQPDRKVYQPADVEEGFDLRVWLRELIEAQAVRMAGSIPSEAGSGRTRGAR
jgi:hypothetical protein